MKFCKYIFKRGNMKGHPCNTICSPDSDFCSKHSRMSDSNIIYNHNTTDNLNNKKDKQKLKIRTYSYYDLVTPESSSSKIKNDTRSDTTSDKSSDTNTVKRKVLNKHILTLFDLKQKINELDTSEQNKQMISKHLDNMKKLDTTSTEYYKNQVFVETAIKYPWNTSFDIRRLITKKNPVEKLIDKIKTGLDKEIYGMETVKNQIINYVCKLITNPNNDRNILALCGPAGVGKNKFIKVLSDVLNLPMKSISLGGIKDSSFFLGHGYVYVESGPGKIIQNVIDSGINNPILMFDELDKVSETASGKDIYSFLSYLTDSTQNKEFSEHYFYGMKFDLSKIFYIFTFNDPDKIDRILMDRLNIIYIDTPKQQEICHILNNYSIKEIVKNTGIKQELIFKDSHINQIIEYYGKSIDKTVSSGIREYYRILEKIIMEINKDILLGKLDYSECVNEKSEKNNDETYKKNRNKLYISDKQFEHYFKITKLLERKREINISYTSMYI